MKYQQSGIRVVNHSNNEKILKIIVNLT